VDYRASWLKHHYCNTIKRYSDFVSRLSSLYHQDYGISLVADQYPCWSKFGQNLDYDADSLIRDPYTATKCGDALRKQVLTSALLIDGKFRFS
jgi:hypothetical protein